MAKNLALFEDIKIEEKDGYSQGITTPLYTPKQDKPDLLECVDNIKAELIVDKIKKSKISDKEKDFLIKAASRHIVFNYARIADYYISASREMQDLMEESALVILDFDCAIENGYIALSREISNLYGTDYEK